MKLLYALPFFALALTGCLANRGLNADNSGGRPQFDPTIAQKDVVWNEGRVARDPQGAIGWSQLAAAYLKVARLKDDNDSAIKAEKAAEKSLSIRRYNNVNAQMRLAQAVLEQHRFADALADTEEAMKIDPSNTSPHQLHAEILVELGRYDEAWAEYKKYALSGLSGAALEARLLQTDGDTTRAAGLLAAAAKTADANWDMAPEAKSWFHLKYGTILWDQGKVSQAADEFKAAIDVNPYDFKSMASLARLSAAQGDLNAAKDWAQKSVAITPTVDAASLLEDIANGEGNKDDESKYQTLVDKVSHPDMYKFLSDPTTAAPLKPHTHDRLYAMYLADHARNLPDALTAAQKDLTSRSDIYAYDTLAWVLHQMGRDTEARVAMTTAMARGTKDAKMFYHAGLIDAALGQKPMAIAELSKALALNPDFQYQQNDQAKQELTKLQAQP